MEMRGGPVRISDVEFVGGKLRIECGLSITKSRFTEADVEVKASAAVLSVKRSDFSRAAVSVEIGTPLNLDLRSCVFKDSLLAGLEVGAVYLRELLKRGTGPFRSCLIILFWERAESEAEDEAAKYVLERLAAWDNVVYSFPKGEILADLNWQNEEGGASERPSLTSLRCLPDKVDRFRPQVRAFVNRLLARRG
jgi:hypothetical protein